MSQQTAEQHGPGYEIVVNGSEFTVPQARISYDEVVDLAFPGGRSDPEAMFRVDYEDARSQPTSGVLAEGGHVEVERKGTEFIVLRSVRS